VRFKLLQSGYMCTVAECDMPKGLRVQAHQLPVEGDDARQQFEDELDRDIQHEEAPVGEP
jgi:hypothetical protein